MSDVLVDAQAADAEGQRLFALAQYEAAIEQFALAQRAYAGAGRELDGGEMLNNIGVVHRHSHKYEQAAHALEQARQIFERLADRSREAQVLGNLGGLYSQMKRYDRSEACFQRAVELFQALDDRPKQSETLRALAIMQFKRGQRSQALATYEDALYFLPNAGLLQRFIRFFLKVRGAIVRFSPFK